MDKQQVVRYLASLTDDERHAVFDEVYGDECTETLKAQAASALRAHIHGVNLAD